MPQLPRSLHQFHHETVSQKLAALWQHDKILVLMTRGRAHKQRLFHLTAKKDQMNK